MSDFCYMTLEDWKDKISGFGNTLFMGIDMFQTIYVSIPERDEDNKLTGKYNVVDIGVPQTEIYEMFLNLNDEVAFAGKYYEEDSLKTAYQLHKFNMKIRQIVSMNRYKYLNLIKSMGYDYNPIWNVDGTEKHSTLTADGNTTNATTQTGSIINNSASNASGSGIETPGTITNKGSTYNSGQNLIPESETSQTQTSNSNSSQSSGTSTTSFDNYTSTITTSHEELGAEGSRFNADTAFGFDSPNADNFFTETTVRAGNIGITATQDLLEKEREIASFSIIKEFFNDITPYITLGVYL